jgi:molybdopterin converting factor small subunit
MKVRFFGRLRDAIGDEIQVDVPPRITDSDALRHWLARDHPVLADPTIKMALDDHILIGAERIDGAKEISFLPPVSGG